MTSQTVMAAPIGQNKDDDIICEDPLLSLESEDHKDNSIHTIPSSKPQTENVSPNETVVQIHMNNDDKLEVESTKKRTHNEVDPGSDSDEHNGTSDNNEQLKPRIKRVARRVGKKHPAAGNKATIPKPNKSTKPKNKINQSDIDELKGMMVTLTGNMSDIQKQLSQVETNVTSNVAKMIDVKINEKLSIAKKEIKSFVTTEMGKVRTEFERKLKGANDHIKESIASMNTTSSIEQTENQKKKNNVVIRNLKEHYNETGELGNEKNNPHGEYAYKGWFAN